MKHESANSIFDVKSGSMNPHASKGTRIIFSNPNYGMPYDSELAAKFLETGKTYTVDRTEVYSSFTKVFLIEVPDVPFNSVLFADVDQKGAEK